MPLVHKSIRIDLPNQLPFDRDTDLEAFAGEYILPIEKKLKWFWFTRYGTVGQRHILFRFSTTKFERIEAHLNNITNIFGGAGCEGYDYVIRVVETAECSQNHGATIRALLSALLLARE
jgi:hypothetical protein